MKDKQKLQNGIQKLLWHCAYDKLHFFMSKFTSESLLANDL